MVRQSNVVAAPVFYPDGGQCIPETSLHLTLRDIVGFKILYSTDYSDPSINNLENGSTMQYIKPILLRDLRGGEVLIKAISVSDDGITQSSSVARAFHINSDPPAVVEEAERLSRRQKIPSSTSVNAAMTPPSHMDIPPLEVSEGLFGGFQSTNKPNNHTSKITDAFSQSPSHFGSSAGSIISSTTHPHSDGQNFSRMQAVVPSSDKGWSSGATTFSSRPPPPEDSFDTKPLPPPPENEVTSLDYLSSILSEEKDTDSPMQDPPGSTSDTAQHVCDHCGRSWSVLERMLRHKVHCRGPSRPSKSRSPSRKVHWGSSSSQVVAEGVKSDTQSNNSGYSGTTTVTHQSYISAGGASAGGASAGGASGGACYNSSYTGRSRAAYRSISSEGRSYDSNGSFSNCNSVLSSGTSGGRPGMGRLGFSSPPNSTHSSMTRGSRISVSGHPKPNIKSPNRKPLSQPKSLCQCPWCGREMKQAALDVHVRRCTEEPGIKKMQAIETENRRRARLSNSSNASAEATNSPQHHPVLRKRPSFSGSLSSVERGPSDDNRRSISPHYNLSSIGISPVHNSQSGDRFQEPASPTDRESVPIQSSAALQGRRDARKRAKRIELSPDGEEIRA